jgi:hypothetical protein
MADRYWVGGTGTWNTTSTTNWSASSGGASGASVPTASDSVIFDQSSTYTVTLTGALTCLNFTVSAGTVTFSSTGTLNISGLLSLVAATVWNATGTITFSATSGTNTITTNAVSISASITFNGVGGTFQLASALTLGSTRTTTLTNGTLDLNNYTLTAGIFSSNNSNTRVLAFGTGNITLIGLSTTIWSLATATNFSYTGTPTVDVTGVGTTGTRTISSGSTAGGTETNAPSFNISAGTDSITTTGNSVIKNLDFSGFTGNLNANGRFIYGNLTLSSGMTLSAAGAAITTFAATSGTKTITTAGQTLDFPVTFNGIGGTWAMQDALTLGSAKTLTLTNGTLQLKSGVTSTVGSFVANSSNVKYLQSTTPGSQATISKASGTVTVSDLTIQDSNATGGASWTAYADYENIDAGNNDGWDFSISPPYATYEPPIIIRSFTQPRRF